MSVISEVDVLASRYAAGMPASEQASLLVEIEAAARALEALRTRVIGDFDAAGGASLDGSPSTAAWLRHHCGFDPRDAQQRVQTARVLRELPLTADALASGRIPFASVTAIAALARDAPMEVMRACEAEMLVAAKQLNPQQLRALVARLRYTYARDAVARDEASRYQLRQLHLAGSFERLETLNAWLLPETAAGLRILLENRLTPPAPGDDRSRPQRMHDAFAAWIDETLSTGAVRRDGGERPHVTVVVDLHTLQDAPGAPPAILEQYGPISGEAARRLCCDAQVARVIADGQSEILDAGRTTRTHTPAMKRALIVRDGDSCVIPGCTTPTRWTQVHHLEHWAHGGGTNLGNLAHVCLPHHHNVHEERYTLTRQPDGTWTWTPP